MKKISVVLLAIIAFAGAACEQHSAEEMKSAHGDPHGEAIPHVTEVADPKPEPLSPHGVPQNPSGAAPADPHTGDQPAPKFFPEK